MRKEVFVCDFCGEEIDSPQPDDTRRIEVAIEDSVGRRTTESAEICFSCVQTVWGLDSTEKAGINAIADVAVPSRKQERDNAEIE